MALDFSDAKAKVEQALADVQAEVGSFLTKKALILRLPDMPLRGELLTAQDDLEQESVAFVARAADLKSRIPDKFSAEMLLNIPRYLNLVQDAIGAAQDGMALRTRMRAHVKGVDAATAGIEARQEQDLPTPKEAEYSQNSRVAMGLGAMLLIYMVMRNK